MNYIDGSFCPTRPDFASINPSNEEAIGYFPQSTKAEINEAVEAARKALSSWRKISRIKRSEYLDNLAQLIKRDTDKIAKAISLETGKSLNESKAEVIEALHMVQYSVGKAREELGKIVSSELSERESYTIRKPKGVIAIIAPWNFPYAINYWTSAPALLEGNTIVMKPSEDTPMVGQIIADLYNEVGLPPGVFNLIHGDGEVGDYLINNNIDHICFTGSAAVGKIIRQACAKSIHTTCSCEMGSKSAVMVFEDADMDLALSATIASAFKLSGQRCVSSGRMLIHRSRYDEFCSRFVELAGKIKVGDPFTEPDSMYGPLINRAQLERVMQFNEATKKNAKVLLEGKRLERKGYFLTPHVYQTEWNNSVFLKEEVFGPHVALVPFNDLEDAIRIYNDTQYGLALGCITNDYRVMREVRDRCEAGMMYFNLGSIGAESHFPFTGVKASGYGGGSAAATFDNVVHTVAVTTNHGKTLNFPQGLK